MIKTNGLNFNILIDIKVPTETTDASGDTIQSFQLHFQTWADRINSTSEEKEEVEAMKRTSTDMVEFIIRYPFGYTLPTSKMKVYENRLGFEYDIENIRIEGLNKYLVLVCKQRQQK